MHAIGSRVSLFAVLDGDIMGAGRAHSHLASEESGIADNDMFLSFNADAGALGLVGVHLELDAFDGVVGPGPQDRPGSVVAEYHLPLALGTQSDREILAAIGNGHSGTWIVSRTK